MTTIPQKELRNNVGEVLRRRRRAIDLAIAATANVHGVPLMTADFAIIEDLVDVRDPASPEFS